MNQELSENVNLLSLQKAPGFQNWSWQLASLAISAGADIKAIQRMLGHGDARMTLNTYGHLYEDNLDSLMDAVESAKKVELSSKSATILQF